MVSLLRQDPLAQLLSSLRTQVIRVFNLPSSSSSILTFPLIDMKWFNLPGAKEAFVQTLKLKVVDDASLDIPWIKFYTRRADEWDFFAVAFPDQAWVLKQIHIIDKSIDEALVVLERLAPETCRPNPWIDMDAYDLDDDIFAYYRNTAAMQRQRELIHHFARVLRVDKYESDETDRVKLETFRSLCTDLIETACLKERAKLVRKLISEYHTSALLGVTTSTDASIWETRQEVVRRGMMTEKAMQKICEKLGLEIEAVDNQDDDYDDDDEDEVVFDDEPNSAAGDVNACVKEIQGACCCDACDAEDRSTVKDEALPNESIQGSQHDLPLRCCSTCGSAAETKKAQDMDDDWTGVADEDEA
jgi:hypothetical protein